LPAEPNVTRWTPLVIQSLREAGIPERDLATWTAATLALIHRESRGNPDIEHRKSGAYGLTQQKEKFHPQHRGNPLEHLRHYARIMGRYYRGPTAGHVPSTLMIWASGPGALSKFVTTGEAAHTKVLPHIRNIQDMLAGRGWRDYSSWLTGWISAGSPTVRAYVGPQRLTLAEHTRGQETPLASPWDGRLIWYKKFRKVGKRGPGGRTSLVLPNGTTSFFPLIAMAAALLALLTWWGAGKG
jgi:hypothetical protein